ncbi:MAG: hypothetical protein GXO39_04115, partial [Thermotogae bacterium]|nr:hypothetical protein [Thermotogota bacterium]
MWLLVASIQVGGKTYLRYSTVLQDPYPNEVALDRMYIILKYRKGNLLTRFTTDVAPLTKLVGAESSKSAYAVYVKHAYIQLDLIGN